MTSYRLTPPAGTKNRHRAGLLPSFTVGNLTSVERSLRCHRASKPAVVEHARRELRDGAQVVSVGEWVVRRA